MTQRHGGIFSDLSERDLKDLNIVLYYTEDSQTLDNLNSQTSQDLYSRLSELHEDARGFLQDLTMSQSRGNTVDPKEFLELRQIMAIMRRLRAKLKRKIGKNWEPWDTDDEFIRNR